MKKKSKSKVIAEKTIFACFKILKQSGGRMRGKEVVDKIRQTIEFNEYETHIFEKTGYVRWESILHFYTIDCMKAGFLLKENGVWILTPEGEKAIGLGPEKLLETATKKYREWSTSRESDEEEDLIDDPLSINSKNKEQKAILSQVEEKAIEGIREFIVEKGAYEFQDLIAALLSGMGYFIAHVAEKGPDGGIDVIAYNDPLGTQGPRIVVQVKHRPNETVPSDDIQKLLGVMKRSTDVGIFATSGRFSKPALTEARNSHKHIELIDLDRFISLWKEHYNKLSDENRNLLPLQPVYFLGSND